MAMWPTLCMRDGDRWICSSEKYHLRFEAITIHHTGKPVVVVQTLLSMNRENSKLWLVWTKILGSLIGLHNSKSVFHWWKIYKNAGIGPNFWDVLWENKYCEDDILTIRFSILRILWLNGKSGSNHYISAHWRRCYWCHPLISLYFEFAARLRGIGKQNCSGHLSGGQPVSRLFWGENGQRAHAQNCLLSFLLTEKYQMLDKKSDFIYS